VLFLFCYFVLRKKKESEPKKEVSRRVPEPRNEHRQFPLEKLADYSGLNPKSPIYLACKGIVFDVTLNEHFYGPGGPYSGLAGKEASRALAKMDPTAQEADGTVGPKDLLPGELETLDDWHNKFQYKYPIVGKVVNSPWLEPKKQA